MDIKSLVEEANSILREAPGPHGDDPRWRVIMEIGHYVDAHPQEIWRFVRRWGGHEDAEVRKAVASCLLEHLLEHHFNAIFPRVEKAVKRNPRFADMFCQCWKFGQSKLPENERRFDELQDWCRNTPTT